MEKLFIPYELAEKLKEKEFDEFCFGFYNCISVNTLGNHTLKYFKENNLYSNSTYHPAQVCAPTYDQVINWFREKHSIYITALPYRDSAIELYWYYSLIQDNEDLTAILCNENDLGCVESDGYDAPNEALQEAINEALKLI